MKKILLLALGFVAAASTAALAAPASEDTHVVTVRYGDLNPNRTADAQRLLVRLDAAAANACGASTFSFREVKDEVRRTACYHASMDRAVAAVNTPAINSLYAQRAQQLAQN